MYRMIKDTGLRYAFLTRMQYFSDDVLDSINDVISLRQMFRAFYRDFERCMNRGKKHSVTYNLHAFYHSLDQRKGECWKFSAEGFESSYFVIKKMFAKGSKNRTKQILSKYLVRDLVRHTCHLNRKMVIKKKKTLSQDNSIFTMMHHGQMRFVRVREEREDSFLVSTIRTSPFQTEEGLVQLPWHLIGVYQYDGETEETCQAFSHDFTGKGVIVANTICMLHLEWMQSSLQQ